MTRVAEGVKKGEVLVYDADLSSFFDTIPHDKLMAYPLNGASNVRRRRY